MYGDDIVSSSADERALDPARRAGILSLPGVMAALSHAEATSPTLRGYAVLSSFLCAPPPPPPAGVNVTLPEVGPDASSRERLEAHFSDPSCGSCHRSMDGLGFAFESIDWLGRSRDEEHGRAIEDASMFVLGGEEVQRRRRRRARDRCSPTATRSPHASRSSGRATPAGVPENE